MVSRSPDLPQEFDRLSREFTSIGQNQNYYENIKEFKENIGISILIGLRDAAWDEDLYREYEHFDAFQRSLLRSVTELDVSKFRDIIQERIYLTPFHFEYHFPHNSSAKVEIKVDPADVPPSNIHVIIGRNGAGKTQLLNSMSDVICNGDLGDGSPRVLFYDENEKKIKGERAFSNIISVAFSAFDEFEGHFQSKKTKSGINYTYIGLRKVHTSDSGKTSIRIKSPREQKGDFIDSILICLRSSRKPRWRAAMRILENDPLFSELKLEGLADLPQDEIAASAGNIFESSSSGHKIVLLAMTRLVELVSERTLVLIDEPESHLHPPLIASFVRALSNLLVLRNGIAILATHSPVVVQEVPRQCVSLLFRSGNEVVVERPNMETFAENVSALTSHIFRVELTESGYYEIIRRIVRDYESLEEASIEFNDKLGAEGRALLRAMWKERQ